MKKNTMMRIASFLLIAVLLSTSAISGTYAKYVTTASGEDSARVAHFGVTIEIVSASSFHNEYTDTTNGLTVKSIDDAKVVAPGTSSSEVAGDVTFKITGRPEVATQLDIDFTVLHDIYLGANTYEDPTTAATDSFEVKQTYYPVVFSLTSSKTGPVATGNLAAIEAALDRSVKNAPTTTLDETFTLTWVWAFEGDQTLNGFAFDAHTVDAADTMLGNLAVTPNPAIDYDTNIGYELKITVTQID